MTYAQMAIATRSTRTWLNNARRILAKRVHRTPSGARWWGMVWMLNQELGLSLKSAARVADLVLVSPTVPARIRLAATSDGAIALRIDLERFHSTANAAVAAALAFGRPRGRGRPRKPRPRRPLIDVFSNVWEIRVERDTAKLERLGRQLHEWNAYPRGIEGGLPFIMDAATLRAVPHLALRTSKGDIDVLLVEAPDANDPR
ncbi:MAG: hypothetical protein ACREN6_01265 [Gemmatimonadaceae bacterium]